MLTLLQISKLKDFYNYNFDSADSTPKAALIVTPNPQIADFTRKSFENAQHQIESVTISKFIKDELNSLIEVEELENFRGKSELNLLLGTIWKRINDEGDYVGFKKAFNLLTELRSFSMSSQVFESVLEHYDSKIAEAVMFMHRILEDMEIIDEHKSYFLLSERLRAGDLPPEKETERVIIFHGFDFMTASQVDLIKSLSLRDQVHIPIYKNVYEKSASTDWIRWFDEYNLEIKDISDDFEETHTINYEIFAKGYFAKALQNFTKYETCVLGTKTLSPTLIQEVSLENCSFKASVDLFGEEMVELREEVEKLIKIDSEISVLKIALQKMMRTSVEKKEYRKLKTIMVFFTTISSWENLSSENSSISDFELEILFESAQLDCPRINLTSLAKHHHHQIHALNSIDEIKDKKVVLGIHAQHQAYKGINANYSEGVEKYLASIGPIRRAEFEVNSFKERFKEFISDNEVILLIESGILEHDINWSEILTDFELESQEVQRRYRVAKKALSFEKKEYNLESVSASKLQKYYDCPQKFYFQYVDKIIPRIEFEDELIPMELGNIQHKLIELYFERYSEYNEEHHEKLIRELLEQSLSGMNVSRELAQEYFVELKSFTKDVILKIFYLKNDLNLNVSFELPFKSHEGGLNYTGSIDCFLTNGEMTILLDFKRSSSVFQSFTGILEYDQIQLWFYLARLIEMGKISPDDNLSFGYINLSDFKTSMLFTNEKDHIELFKKDLEISKVKLVENLPEHIKEFGELEKRLVDKLKSEKNFPPAPRKPQVCDFCDLNNICPRSGNGQS